MANSSVGLPIALGVLYPIIGVLLSPLLAAAAMSFQFCDRDLYRQSHQALATQ